jgi:hypothetical protein
VLWERGGVFGLQHQKQHPIYLAHVATPLE